MGCHTPHQNIMKPREQRLKEKLGSCSAIILPVHMLGRACKVYKRDKNLYNEVMGPVWLQGTIHASYNRIHQSAAHLSAAGLSWLWALVQEVLAVRSLTALRGGRGRCSQQRPFLSPWLSTSVCSSGLPCEPQRDQAHPQAGQEQQLEWAAQPMQGGLENTETLSFSVLESAAKPHYAVTCS